VAKIYLERATNKDYLTVATLMLTLCFFGYLIQKELLFQRADYLIAFMFALALGTISLVAGSYPILHKWLTHHTTV
jgi:hypothetical protein